MRRAGLMPFRHCEITETRSRALANALEVARQLFAYHFDSPGELPVLAIAVEVIASRGCSRAGLM
jgi:hypothetical protein